jgi:hypothetical protein
MPAAPLPPLANAALAALALAAAAARVSQGTATVSMVEGAPCFAPGDAARDARVSGVSVAHAQKPPGSDWRVAATEVWGFRGRPPGIELARLAPQGCIRYGATPADAADPVAPQALRPNRAYTVEIHAAPAGGGRASAWSAVFCLAEAAGGTRELRLVRSDPTAGPWPENACPP